MAETDDKGLLDRLGEILNAPLPGTRRPGEGSAPAEPSGSPEDAEGRSLVDRIRDILSTPLPGTETAEVPAGSAPAPVPSASGGTHVSGAESPVAAGPAGTPAPTAAGLAEDTLAEDWWRRDWQAFRSHQDQESRGLGMKHEQDRAKLAAVQEQERQRFAAHQQLEAAQFYQYQQWKLDTWRQYQAAVQAGRQVPPPAFTLPPGVGMPPGMPPGMMPPGGPMGGPPGMMPPPWLMGPGGYRPR